MDAHISNSCRLGNGVDSKQSRVGIIGIESTDLFNTKMKQGKLQRFQMLNLMSLDAHIYIAN